MVLDFSNPDLFNQIYLPFLHTDKRFRILYGGRDSGKSDAVAQISIIDMLRDDYLRLILLRKYYRAIKDSQFQTIIDYIRMWELQDLFHITTNPLQITCKHNNNIILARGLDQPDNLKSIKDPTAVWYEEADQISEYAFIESSLSLRVSRKNIKYKEWITFNPRRETSWLNNSFFPAKSTYEKSNGNFHWVNSVRDNALILHTNYKDNRFCNHERIKNIEALKTKDQNHYNVNTLGLWGGALKGLIYPEFKTVKEMPYGDTVFGLDYGFNHPAALVQVTYYENSIYIKELFYLTNHHHVDITNLMVREFKNLIGHKQIYVDCAAPELIKLLRESGFNAQPSVKGPNSVYDGIMLCKSFDNIYTTNDSLNVIKEFESYVWRLDKDDKPIDEPVKFEDDAMDSWRYCVQSYGKVHWIKKQSSTYKYIKNQNKREDFSGY